MQHNAISAQADVEHGGEQESVVVHVQLRPRRGATRKCLAALASLAAEHEDVSFAVSGLSKDDRVVRVTVGVDLGPRTAVAKFSPQAQAAYAFVSALFTSLYDHMPVYVAEPSQVERAAAAVLLERAAGGAAPADVVESLPATGTAVPNPRPAGPGERIPA
ncbi:hypothetical protein [Blastococcus sp. CCUG 61487]|uniref:hypothetical protein n=1 Tax=Blastococcus sp. CCUG 61487 TaxID=1840703 RepID=UPI0010C06E48|nr:hypothetical protein [Blastococcus sp. CCUG 61487]TKJ21487.1 hypothetical protein A6V29_07280 [Blastococcus sp. CCUG 61487]